MPASSEAALFDYEGNIEDPLATALGALMTGVQFLTPRTPQAAEEKKETPRIEIALSVTGSPFHHCNDPAGVEYRDSRQGLINFLCAVRRDAAGQSLGTLRGGLRANLRKGKTLLNATNLPLYQVIEFEEVSSQPQFDAENDEIQCLVVAEVEWRIRPDQFPAP